MASNGNGQWRNRIVSSGVADPDQLLANPSNWRIHPRNQQDALTGVLDEVGYVQDVIVNKRTSEEWPAGERGIETLVDGHLRVMLAMRHNEQQIPVKYVDLSPHEEALILATLDPISALAAPDAAKLDAVLREVRTGSEDVQTLLNDLAHDAGLNYGGAGDADAEPQIDRAAELNEKWHVKTGDLWRIGEHRLYCGDSEHGIDLIRGDYKIDAVITDPPYGINIVKGISAAAIGGAKPFGRVRPPGCRTPTGKVGVPGVVEPRLYRPVANDDKPFDPTWLLDLAHTIILFGANHFASRLPDSPAWLVWEKNVSDQSTFSACELAWCNVGNHVRRYEWTWSGMVRAGEREVEMKDRIHPTQKPVGLIEKVIQDYTSEREVIADTYLGSGTTMLASARINRICVGGELDEAYCAVILERMAKAFPGIEIERIGNA